MNTVRLWDAATGAELRRLEGHTDWVWSVSFSPDGRTLASGSGGWGMITRPLVGCGDGRGVAAAGRAYGFGLERIVQPGWTDACQWE